MIYIIEKYKINNTENYIKEINFTSKESLDKGIELIINILSKKLEVKFIRYGNLNIFRKKRGEDLYSVNYLILDDYWLRFIKHSGRDINDIDSIKELLKRAILKRRVLNIKILFSKRAGYTTESGEGIYRIEVYDYKVRDSSPVDIIDTTNKGIPIIINELVKSLRPRINNDSPFQKEYEKVLKEFELNGGYIERVGDSEIYRIKLADEKDEKDNDESYHFSYIDSLHIGSKIKAMKDLMEYKKFMDYVPDTEVDNNYSDTDNTNTTSKVNRNVWEED